ncbi:MAG TPA: hypothetical protein VMI30_10135 [Stellaceae bacterium]|nr:hypothetical protein [Stellaceae bacterium]
MLIVEIEKPENEPLSVWFASLRDWLDANRCPPSAFTACGRRIDRLIYRISFDTAALAHSFCQDFARYSPTIRRATQFERDQLRAMTLSAERVPDVADASLGSAG